MTDGCVVIGSGVAGLTSAALLAAQGRPVTLVEEAPALGPVLRGFTRGGAYFDTGFHYTGGLAKGEILDRFFHFLGLARRLVKVPLDPAGFDRYQEEDTGFAFAYPVGMERFAAALYEAFPGEVEAVRQFVAGLEAACASLPYLNLELDFTREGGLNADPGESLGEVLDRLTGDSRLKRVLSLHTLLHGIAPHEVPFRYHAAVAGLYYRSAHGIAGGGRAVVDGFAARLEELGVRVRTGRAVTHIEASAGGAVAGVRLTDGEFLPCTTCVSTVHPKRLLPLVPDGVFRGVYRRRIEALEETISANLLFLRCDPGVEALTGGNVIVVPGGQAPGAEWHHQVCYVNRSKGAPGGDVGNGVVAIQPARFADFAAWADSRRGSRPAEYLKEKARVADQLLTVVQTNCPELAGRVHPVAGATPLTLRDYCGSPSGGLYGVKHTVAQVNPLPLTRLRGLFLAGQATTAAGLLGAMMSAFLCCGHIVGQQHLLQGVRECL